jgi:tetratricopeptide (TPR) repeat protein
MLDYQRIVEDLRSFARGGGPPSDAVRRRAAEYEEACHEVNERLRRCEDYLHQGLRSEALHFAEGEPVLLEAVAVLDFPGRGQWEQSAAQNRLPPPPRLLLETAEALNRAYAREKDLDGLLREHRRLALARAPLRQRLAVLYRLRERDSGNPLWPNDLAAFETSRFRQMREEVEQAARRLDAEALVGLVHELQHTPWTQRPPESLVQYITAMSEGSNRQHARNQLQELGGALHDALAAQDHDQVRALAARWRLLAAEAQLVPGVDPLWLRAEPALRWLTRVDRRLAQEKAFQEALNELERALGRNISSEDLGQCYQAVLRFKRDVDPDLVQRYRARLAWLETMESWRERLILAATFAIGTLALVGFLLFLLLRNHG